MALPVLSSLPDVVAAVAAGLAAHDKPRGDEDALHASDLGKCRLAVWARRNGHAVPGSPEYVSFSSRSRARMQAGLRDEEWLMNLALAPLQAEGWGIDRSPELPAGLDLVGHLDAVLWRPVAGGIERALVEVKTTAWKECWVETDEPKPDGKSFYKRKVYRPYDDAPGRLATLQAGAYARRLPKNPDGHQPPFGILQMDRNTQQMAWFGWYDAEDADLVLDEQAELLRLAVTANGMARPDGDPSEKWMCAYCNFGGCYRNVNPDAEAIA
jgi:hypothetical protein